MGLPESASPDVAVSVVSHGHGQQLFQLLCTLENLCARHLGHVIVTLNIPEPDLLQRLNAKVWSFKLTTLQNPHAKGFGSNHNAAFQMAGLDYFCVMNPDIDFSEDPFPELKFRLIDRSIGCSFPVQIDVAGEIQDYARKLPSPPALLARYLFPDVRGHAREKPDWVNGAFMFFPTAIFVQLNGFDERYFMYCEDVDICLRLQCAGYGLGQTDGRVIHLAQRSSRFNFQHLTWHVGSLFRLWLSSPYRQYSRTGARRCGY